MTKEELISKIKTAIDDNGGEMELPVACGCFNFARFSKEKNCYEVKYYPCWDVIIWYKLEELGVSELEKICLGIN